MTLLEEFPPPGDWMRKGSCRGLDSRIFFPPQGGSLEAAREICAGCPVKLACEDYALKHRRCEGVWAGLCERERRMIRRRRGIRVR